MVGCQGVVLWLKWPIPIKQRKQMRQKGFYHKHLKIRESWNFDPLSCRYKPAALVQDSNNGTGCNIFSKEIMINLDWNSQEIIVHISFLKKSVQNFLFVRNPKVKFVKWNRILCRFFRPPISVISITMLSNTKLHFRGLSRILSNI